MPDSAVHMIKSYDEQLNRLRSLVGTMGTIVESQVVLATDAIVNRDRAAAMRAVEADLKTDALEREIEQFAIRLLALRQPLAGDLRQIVGALKISDDLERIGDYAANVARRATVLAESPTSVSLVNLARMAELVQQNLHRMVNALGDTAAEATEVWCADKAIDDTYNIVSREIATHMIADPHNITACTHLLFIARNLERIGDHATNIAESIYYAATGDELAGPRPKGGEAISLAETAKT